MALLWPLWRTSLRTSVADVLLCSDATLTRGNVAHTSLSVEEATWFYAKSQIRGGGVFEGRDEQGELIFRTSGAPLADHFLWGWIGSKPFDQSCNYTFGRFAPIDLREVVALRTLVKHAADRAGLRGTRIPILLDSRVCQQVALWGHSFSSKLNSIY